MRIVGEPRKDSSSALSGVSTTVSVTVASRRSSSISRAIESSARCQFGQSSKYRISIFTISPLDSDRPPGGCAAE
jgi:hypothetical protein